MNQSINAGRGVIEKPTWQQHVRKRPGLYIGDPTERGLMTCILELLSGAHVQYRCGRCDLIEVCLEPDGSITITDNRQGRCFKPKHLSDLAFLARELTEPDIRWKKPTSFSLVELGLCGVGPSCVAALSEWLTTRWTHRGKINELRLSRGIIQKRQSRPLSAGARLRVGNVTSFKPDPEIFRKESLDFARFAWRMREIAFLSPGLRVRIEDRRTANGRRPRSNVFLYPRGSEDFLGELLLPTGRVQAGPLIIAGKSKGVSVQAAVAYQESVDCRLLSYVNYQATKWGSTHVEGFLDGLAEAINSPCWGKRTRFTGHFVRQGLHCVLSVQMPAPRYSGALKERLCNTEAYDIVRSICRAGCKRLFKENPEWHEAIVRHLHGIESGDRDMRSAGYGG